MDDATSQKISELLKNPEMLSKITSVISGLTQNNSQVVSTPAISETPSFHAIARTPNDKTALLNSLKPLIRDDKRHKIDKLINALTIAAVVKEFKGGNENVQQ